MFLLLYNVGTKISISLLGLHRKMESEEMIEGTECLQNQNGKKCWSSKKNYTSTSVVFYNIINIFCLTFKNTYQPRKLIRVRERQKF